MTLGPPSVAIVMRAPTVNGALIPQKPIHQQWQRGADRQAIMDTGIWAHMDPHTGCSPALAPGLPLLSGGLGHMCATILLQIHVWGPVAKSA